MYKGHDEHQDEDKMSLLGNSNKRGKRQYLSEGVKVERSGNLFGTIVREHFSPESTITRTHLGPFTFVHGVGQKAKELMAYGELGGQKKKSVKNMLTFEFCSSVKPLKETKPNEKKQNADLQKN